MSWKSEARKRPLAAASLLFIICCVLLAIGAYALINDQSANANNQMPEITLRDAGFQAHVFIEPLSHVPRQSWLSRILFGKNLSQQHIAYDSMEVVEGNIRFFTPNGSVHTIKYSGLNSHQYVHSNTHLKTFILGTDKYGRDAFSRLLLGIRISLVAGFMAVLVSLIIGVLLGSISGYFGGWIDQCVLFMINVTWSIPTILLVFAIVLALGRGIGVIFLAIGLTIWVDVARIVRGQVLSLKEEQFILAAKSLGQVDRTILFKHILPNIIGPVLVIIAANFATAILIEAGLSYLGFGVNPPAPSLGNILNENYGYILSGHYSLALAPAVLVMLLVLSFNLLGSGLRDYFDIKD